MKFVHPTSSPHPSSRKDSACTDGRVCKPTGDTTRTKATWKKSPPYPCIKAGVTQTAEHQLQSIRESNSSKWQCCWTSAHPGRGITIPQLRLHPMGIGLSPPVPASTHPTPASGKATRHPELRSVCPTTVILQSFSPLKAIPLHSQYITWQQVARTASRMQLAGIISCKSL